MEDEIPVTASATVHLVGRTPYTLRAHYEPLAPPLQPYIRVLFGDGSGVTAIHATLSLEQARELRGKLAQAIEEGLESEVSLDEAVQRG